jgi:hypothetical protein
VVTTSTPGELVLDNTEHGHKVNTLRKVLSGREHPLSDGVEERVVVALGARERWDPAVPIAPGAGVDIWSVNFCT